MRRGSFDFGVFSVLLENNEKKQKTTLARTFDRWERQKHAL